MSGQGKQVSRGWSMGGRREQRKWARKNVDKTVREWDGQYEQNSWHTQMDSIMLTLWPWTLTLRSQNWFMSYLWH